MYMFVMMKSVAEKFIYIAFGFGIDEDVTMWSVSLGSVYLVV